MGHPIVGNQKPRDISFSSAVVVTAIVVVALNWAEAIFVPILLATLLTFIVQPFVRALEKRGLNRLWAVVLSVMIIGILVVCGFWLVLSEIYVLVGQLPEYTGNISAKIQSLRHLGGESTLKKLDFMVAEINRAWSGESRVARVTAQPSETTGAIPAFPSLIGHASWLVGSAMEAAVNLGLAIVLVFFALLRREAIRSRLLRIVGGQVAATTKALDEAGSRISRYLRRQLFVNIGFGVVWGSGLYLLGVDYAFLWGVLGCMLRYIPYAGPVLAGAFPIVLSIAQAPGWAQPTSVIVFYLTLELLINSIIEPWAYGRSLGISEVALLVSAAFWALVWGPIGLILSGPITVCLAVVGRHVYRFRFLALLLGDEPVLSPHVSLYQRLLARDQDEGAKLVMAHAKAMHERVFDEVLIPCLNLMKLDRQNNQITAEQEQFAIDSIEEMIEELDHVLDAAPDADETKQHRATSSKAPAQVILLGYPARDAEDKLALEMLRHVLDADWWKVETLSADTLTSELIDRVASTTQLVCIGALSPGGIAHTRYICKRLRARFPDVKIAVGRWVSNTDADPELEALNGAGADLIASSLLETRDQLQAWLPVLMEDERVAAVV
ncbi:MAG: AI-2E family transporter [Candidatus Hydrogenedentes bacterium]|nr:AI-2E family transporter [Candidatus Hydrogenedentota bacterium]